MIYDPFKVLEEEAYILLRNAIIEAFPEILDKILITFEEPPPGHGNLAFRCFDIARHLRIPPHEISKKLVSLIDTSKCKYIDKVVYENGYINFYANMGKLGELLYQVISNLREKYGFNPAPQTKTVLIEFLSTNPIHPIHLGGARNAILGDTLSRLLTWRGHKVLRHFYVNDVGRQVVTAAFGYDLLGRPEPWDKPDHVIGYIYALTSSLLEIEKLKRTLDRAKALGKDEYYRAKVAELDEWVKVAVELKERNPRIFDLFTERFYKVKNPEGQITVLIKRYESRDPEAVELIRKMCNMVLEGFKETLDRAGIRFDSFDWESDIAVWSGLVNDVIRKLEATPYVIYSNGALVFLANDVVKDFNLYRDFSIPKGYEVPPLTLVRSDGTTLYTTRDIAYTLWKFKQAERVINVIGIEQKIAQLQLRIALVALGYKDLAKNLIHYGYELVNLPGLKMSGRRGRYITFDELMDEAIKKAKAEVELRSPYLPEALKNKISESVGIGAIKYAFLSVSHLKPVTFNWSKVLNFERNSAPFIQYAHARAYNILTKAGLKDLQNEVNISLLSNEIEKELLLCLIKFPHTIEEAAEKLRPDLLAEYANNLAIIFNSFYDKVPVIHSKNEELRKARLWLVNATRIVLKNALNIMGIAAPSRM